MIPPNGSGLARTHPLIFCLLTMPCTTLPLAGDVFKSSHEKNVVAKVKRYSVGQGDKIDEGELEKLPPLVRSSLG